MSGDNCKRGLCTCNGPCTITTSHDMKQLKFTSVPGVVGGPAGLTMGVLAVAFILRRHGRLRLLPWSHRHRSSAASSPTAGPFHPHSSMVAEHYPSRPSLLEGGHGLGTATDHMPGERLYDEWQMAAVQPLARTAYGASNSSGTRYTGSSSPSNDSWLEMLSHRTSGPAGANAATEVLTKMATLKVCPTAMG